MKPPPSPKVAELKEFRPLRDHHPMMAELYRRAEAQLRKQRRKDRSTPGVPASEADLHRLLHELQVQQVELELQNAELQESRDRMEVLLEQYTDLYEFAPVGYFTLAADGTIQQVNLTGACLVGIDRSRLVGQRFGLLVRAELRAGFHAFLESVFAGQTRQSRDLDLLRPGGLAPLIVNMEAQRLLKGHACRAAVLDITKRRQAEDRVRASESRYRRLFEVMQDGVLLVDPDTRKITDANPFMTRLLGYPHDQLVGKELFEIGLLEDELASKEMFRKLRRQHKVHYDNLPLQNQAGRRQEVEVVASLYQENSQPVIQLSIRDIAERKQAEAAQRRLDVLTASNLKLSQEIVRRKAVEKSLRESERHQSRLVEQSRQMQERLRSLSHRILQVQEDERKRISRELHDEVAQTLTSISLGLTDWNPRAEASVTALRQRIRIAQRLLKKSVNDLHQFARELRPTVLDDLGLIPALHTFLKALTHRTHLHVHLEVFASVEKLDMFNRTVLYRVAQEALTNVARHAKASRVDMKIQKLPGAVRMRIKDDGRSFDVRKALRSKRISRLGLLGMKERLEIVGGSFSVESTPGRGTTVQAEIPLTRARTPRARG